MTCQSILARVKRIYLPKLMSISMKLTVNSLKFVKYQYDLTQTAERNAVKLEYR